MPAHNDKLVWPAILNRLVPLALFGVATALFLPVADYQPFWDGWEFTTKCYQDFAATGDLYCFGHTSYIPTVLFGVVQYFFPGALSISLLTFAAVLACTVVLRIDLPWVLGKEITGPELWAAAFLFPLMPVIFHQIVQPSADLPLALGSILLLHFLIRGRWPGVSLAGILLIFSKETGLAPYGAYLACWGLVFRSAGHGLRVWRYWKPREWAWLMLPVALLGAHTAFAGVWATEEFGRSRALRRILEAAVSFWSYEAQAQYVAIFIINFQWILTLTIAVAFAAALIRWKRAEWLELWQTRKPQAFVFLAFALLLFGITRYIPFNNPRYNSSLYPLLVMAFLISLRWLVRNAAARAAALALALVLNVASMNHTIDPVAKALMGTFSFGEHEMLVMISVPGDTVARSQSVGRDHLFYNLQMTHVGKLIEEVVRQIGHDKKYFGASSAAFFDNSDLRTFRPDFSGRTIHPTERVRIDFSPFGRRTPAPYSGEFYYIALPAAFHERRLAKLRACCRETGSSEIEVDGYSVTVYHFTAGSPD